MFKNQKQSWSLCLVLFWALAALFSAGCTNAKKSKKKDSGSSAPFQIRYYSQNPFTGGTLGARLKDNLMGVRVNSYVATGLNEEVLWAISQCKCSPNFNRSYAKILMSSRGVLPQILVPAVREEVKNNPVLKGLLALPSNPLTDFANTLVDLFMNDDEISKQVRDGLDQKIVQALPGTAPPSRNIPYSFDLYASPFQTFGSDFIPNSMRISEQASKWAFVLSIENLWSDDPNTEPLAFGDHGLQLLLTAQSISEWTYAFGLDENTTTGEVYGGITIDPREGLNTGLYPSDPRKNTDAAGVISGTYSINYPSSGSIQLATNVKETWMHSSDDISLDEQARIWSSTALAYARLKPTSRNSRTESLFAPSTGLFPRDAHSLPLAFLSGMAALLDGPFIDKETRQLYESAKVPGSSQSDYLPQLKTFARLARALQNWLEATENIQNDQHSADITNKIVENQSTLKDAMRLGVQAVLDQYTANEVAQSRLGGIGMITSKNNTQRPAIEEAAEALSVLASIDQVTLNNRRSYLQTDLRLKIIALYHWFAAEYLTDLATGRIHINRPEASLWIYRALRLFSNYDASITKAPWLTDAMRNAEDAVQAWEQSLDGTP